MWLFSNSMKALLIHVQVPRGRGPNWWSLHLAGPPARRRVKQTAWTMACLQEWQATSVTVTCLWGEGSTLLSPQILPLTSLCPQLRCALDYEHQWNSISRSLLAHVFGQIIFQQSLALCLDHVYHLMHASPQEEGPCH